MDNRFRRTDYTVYMLVAMGFVGFVFAIASQSTSLIALWSVNNLSIFAVAIGSVLAIFAAWAGALEAAFNFRWGASLSQELVILGRLEKVDPQVDLFCVVVAFAIASTISTPIHAAAGLLTGESITLGVFVTAVGIGGFVQAMSSISYRASILRTDNLGINAMGYAIPILSLFWLALFSLVNVDRVDYLIIGAAAIITANLLINFEAEIRFGFKALILTLWICGAFVYLRDDLLQHLPFDGWMWSGDFYFEALALSATVFTLILSFRVARLVTRTQDEDNRVFSLFQSLNLLARRGLIDSSIRDYIRAMDGSQSPEELQNAYNQAKLCFAQLDTANLAPTDQVQLAEAEAQLNTLAHSRQQGIEFGELFSLIIFGGITVFLALLSRPDVSDWTGFLIDIFTVLFSSVIVFLIVNVWDLQRDRIGRILQKQPDYDGYGVVFRDARSRRFEQGISIIIGIAVTVAYAGLLWHKWVS